MDRMIEKAPSVLSNLSELGGALTRRTVLKGGASGAAAMGLGALWSNHAFASVGGPGGLQQRSSLLTLVNRVSQGYTASEFAVASNAPGGYAQYLGDVLAGPSTGDAPGDDFLAGFQGNLAWSPQQAYLTAAALSIDPDGLLELSQSATIGLSVVSKHILRERMMDLWSNRLSVYGKKAGNGPAKNYADYHIFRPHALGSFADLLTAFAKDGSALYYLDNVTSSGPIPNQNWAREFLELYSMGQDDPVPGMAPNYTEADVQNAAAAFTGWSWEEDLGKPDFQMFDFKAGLHLSGPKTFLGTTLTVDNATEGEGDQVVSITANSSKTARGVAGKMIRHLLRYDPTPAQVAAAAALYPNIPNMVGNILSEGNVSALTPADYLFSSPSRFVYQALRATEHLRTTSPSESSLEWDDFSILRELQRMGNAPFEWPAPDGYPDDPEKWAGSLFARWEFANKMFTQPDANGVNPELEAVAFTDTQLIQGILPFTTVMDIIDNLDNLFLGGVLSDNEKCVLESFVNTALQPPFSLPTTQVLRELYALCISTPSFQYY